MTDTTTTTTTVTMTGVELKQRTFGSGSESKAERERLGLTVEQLADLARLVLYDVACSETWDDEAWAGSTVTAHFITQALNAEAERQAKSGKPCADRARGPKRPEGVTVWARFAGDFAVTFAQGRTIAIVSPAGGAVELRQVQDVPLDALRFVAEFAQWCSDEQAVAAHARKLAEVEDAEAKYDEARRCADAANYAADRAWDSLATARKEAGL